MRQGLGHRPELQTGIGLRIDPRVILASQLLQLAQAELDVAIDNELQENPALERLHDGNEPLTREVILRSIAPTELAPSTEDFEFHRSLPAGSTDDVVDWLELAPGIDSLSDHLRAQLIPMIPGELAPVGEYLIGCLNERGYLTSSIEEVALDCNCSLEEAEFVLAKLHTCDPPGIGASTIQECLLLQLRQADTLEGKLARGILKHHFEDFRDRYFRPIMRRYKVLPEVVQAAFDLILTLSPFPGEGYRANVCPERSSVAARPDLIFRHSEAGWLVEVVGEGDHALAVSRSYRSRQAQLEKMARPPRDEKQHVGEYVERATRFIDAIEQRYRTLRKIGECLLKHQSGFIATGEFQFLNPLTRTQMAKEIDVHESTVSRATQGKFVQLATGEVVGFDFFFKGSLRVQKMIEEILAHENPHNPLSDERIAQMLAERGVHVARRTVNKYRDRNKQLSSRRRRSA